MDCGFKFTYKALKEVDLLVCIDSAIAHLALCVGVPTFVLLPKYFDWHWGRLESPASIFYPHAHLLRLEDFHPITQNQSTESQAKIDSQSQKICAKICEILGL